MGPITWEVLAVVTPPQGSRCAGEVYKHHDVASAASSYAVEKKRNERERGDGGEKGGG